MDNNTADNTESLPGAVTRIARKRDKKHACAHDLGFQHSRSQSFDPFGQRKGSIGRYFMYGTYIVLILPTYLASLFLFGPLLPCSSVLCYLVDLFPCYSVSLLPCYSVTFLPCYVVTLLLCYLVTLLPCYSVTFLPCNPVTLLPCYSVTL